MSEHTEEFDFSAAESSPDLAVEECSKQVSPQREFLGWDKPLLSLVKSWLLDESRRDQLAETLVVVPTSNSGRRLRMALSEGAGVLSPHVIAPSGLFSIDDGRDVASRQESLWAWIEAIRAIDVTEFPHLLPNHEPGSTKSFSSALALARQMMTLRDMLADGDAEFRDAQQHSIESDRWQELAVIEADMLKCLSGWKLDDQVLAKRKKARLPILPTGVKRVVVACVPDPTLLALRGLNAFLNLDVPVTVLIHAPDTESSAFDPWGIPLSEVWAKKQIEIPHWQERLHVVDSAKEAAEVCVGVFAEGQSSSDGAALALCDPSFAPALNQEFSEAGWALFDPEGRHLAESGLMRLLRVMGSLSGHAKSFESLCELVKLPSSEALLPEGVERHRAAKLMDKLLVDHLPETLSDAEFLSSGEAKVVVKSISEHIYSLKTGKISKTLRIWLAQWLANTDQDVAEAAEGALAGALDAIERLENVGENPRAVEVFDMLAESLQSCRVSSDRAETALDLQGWLEISYDSSPHLVLAGMHEECVPDGSADDAFVPDSLRESLNLRDSRGRFARDAFLLKSAIASRQGESGGRVDAVVSRFNDKGEARKPSRLLMRQKGAQLAALVGHLFAESESTRSIGGVWHRDWQLKLPTVKNPYSPEENDTVRSVSPSAIKDYLNCPLRFYLKRVVGMKTYESGKREMNAMDFGNLCHAVLESFGKDLNIRDSEDAAEIYSFLSDTLESEVKKQYGGKLQLPLMVQLESARERLRAFATEQAAQRIAGWRIVETELMVGGDDISWEVGDHPIRMIIDRIDYHEEDGLWRIWDYKTSGKAKDPDGEHVKVWSEDENRPLMGELIEPSGKQKVPRRWSNVQLPLYAAFVQQHYHTAQLPEVGYIQLPRSVSDVKFALWSDFSDATVEHAMDWTAATIGALREGEFEQCANLSNQESEWDDFFELGPDGLSNTFAMTQVVDE